MQNKGRIKLHRKIVDWERYTDANTFRVFVHCCIKANHKGKQWRGQEIKRGSFISSPSKIGVELGLSRQQIRTAIDKLKVTNNITTKSTNQYSLITIVNYSIYNDDEKENNQPNNHQPNKQITTTNNDKEYIKEKYIKEKDQIRNLFDTEYLTKNVEALEILFDLFIEKAGYRIKEDKKEIEKFVERLKRKSKDTFGYDQIGNHKRKVVYNTVEECFDYHEGDKTMIKKQSHKGRINTRFRNKSKGR